MKAKFVGEYIDDMVLVIVAGLVSGVNVILDGPPGYGKTEVAETVLQQILGERWVSIFLNPSSSPEDVGGRPDIDLLLTENKYVIVTEGTVFDPAALAALLDEATRANDPVWDLLLKPLSGRGLDNKRLPEDQVKVYILTENWSLESDRTEALRDRIGIHWRMPENISLPVKKLAESALSSIGGEMEIEDHLPTIEDILRIRGYRPDDYPTAKKSAVEVVELLAAEVQSKNSNRTRKSGDVDMSKYSFEINPRRVKQWELVLYRFSVFLTGKPDFDQVPDLAKRVLSWMYPTKDRKEAEAWSTIVRGILDPIQAAIDALVRNAYQSAKDVLARSGDDPSARMAESKALGRVIVDGQDNLRMLATKLGKVDSDGNPTDKRIQKAIDDLEKEFGDVVRGA